MNSRTRKLRMEQMESRELMAVTPLGQATTAGGYNPPPSGDVAAYVQNGNLYVNEASGAVNSDNGVRIAQLDNGMIRVMGTTANNSTGRVSSINGYAYQDFPASGSLYVGLKGGNDMLQLGHADGVGAPKFSEIQINTVAPESVVSGKVADPGTPIVPDSDHVMVWGATTRNSVSIITGASNDWVYVRNTTVGDGLGVDNLSINSGSGGDSVDVKGTMIRGNLDITTYGNLNETDSDSVYIDSSNGVSTFVSVNTSIRTGGGNDSVLFTNPSHIDLQVAWNSLKSLGTLSIDTGAGNDTSLIRTVDIGGDISFVGGAGADSLTMWQTQLEGYLGIGPATQTSLRIQMYGDKAENDADYVTLQDTGAKDSVTLLLGGGNDTALLKKVSARRNVHIEAHAGNDTVEVERLSALDNFYALMAEGDDVLKLHDIFGGQIAFQLDGGSGIDRITKTGEHTPIRRLDQVNWEYVNGVTTATNSPTAKKAKK